MKRQRLIALLALSLVTQALPAPAHSQDVLIRNARVHTLTAQGTLERADVLLRGGRIVRVALSSEDVDSEYKEV